MTLHIIRCFCSLVLLVGLVGCDSGSKSDSSPSSTPSTTPSTPSSTPVDTGPDAHPHHAVVITSLNSASEIDVIKAVREVGGIGLAEAKSLVENLPAIVKKGLVKSAAEKLAEPLRAAGVTVEIRHVH